MLKHYAKISIIVPVYRADAYIVRCAESLFQQTMKELEFIFVDDCSPDQSIYFLQKTIERYPNRKNNVKILHNQNNLRQAATRNVGLHAAVGKYVMFIDSDDWIDLDLAEKLYSEAVKNNSDVVSCEFVLETKGKCSPIRFSQETKGDENNFSQASLKEPFALFFGLCNKLVRRNLILQNEIPSDSHITLWEDLSVVFYLRVKGKNFSRISGTYYHYDLSNNNSMTKNIDHDRVMERIAAAKQLEKFLQKNKLIDKYQRIINLLKFISKADLIMQPEISSAKEWRNIYQETNFCCFYYPGLSIFTRIGMLACLLHLDGITKIIFTFRTKIKTYKSSIM